MGRSKRIFIFILTKIRAYGYVQAENALVKPKNSVIKL